MWSRAYLHSGGMNGVTTGIGGVKRRFAGAQRSSSHILHARKHMIEVFVQSKRASYSRKVMSPNPRETAQEPTLVKTLSWMLDSSLQGIGRVLILHSSALLFPFI